MTEYATHPKHKEWKVDSPPDDLYPIDDPELRDGLGLS